MRSDLISLNSENQSYFQVAKEVSEYAVTSTGDVNRDISAQIDAHRAALEKDFATKSDAFSSAQSKYQSAADQVRKYQDRLDSASRKLGGSSFNADGSLNYFVGYSDVSHLRSPLEITRDLHRYLCSDMLRLKQGRLELLLQELNDAFDHEVDTRRDANDSALRTNMSASRSVLNLLRRVGGPNLTKNEIVRKAVRE